MIVINKSNIKCLWLLVLISFICLANARQIRYSRYNTEVIEDNVEKQNSTNVTDNQTVDDDSEIEATVREIKLAPYPASGYRPSRAFPLPNEEAARNTQSDIEAQVTDESSVASTTETIDFTTTTLGYEDETTTTNIITEDNLNEDDSEKVESGDDVMAETEAPKAPYPPAGFQPRIPFLLPTDFSLKSEQQLKEEENLTEIPYEDTTELPAEIEIKAPYPAAGYRPSKAFLLPSEQLQLEAEKKNDSKPQNDNSNHPVCGSSTNPLAPKPIDGEKEDPDSESINVNVQTQQRSQEQRAVVIPVRFSVHPLLLTRPLVYSAPIAATW
ncbi:uncharacterized protein LOC111691058 [Lucilia cuprina]|uniref:uncharacterized protein LOC111691058 n=1 Tax=Lucilia cuprina TaxID=7375 RepID=UPI001F062AC8|nr:uncharacterized protein LOC111691058 [Lucilia cuprina]